MREAPHEGDGRVNRSDLATLSTDLVDMLSIHRVLRAGLAWTADPAGGWHRKWKFGAGSCV